MKIHLRIDDDYSGDDCYWFPFSTPSSSPDGSGWYYMPEVGDQIRVYFPSKKTGDVIAISAVSDFKLKEDTPKNWDMGDSAAVSKKQGMKELKAAKMPAKKLTAVTMEPFMSGMALAKMPAVGTAAVIKEPLLKNMSVARMQAFDTAAISNAPVMKRMDISKFSEMNTMPVSKALGVKTLDVSKAPATRAVTKAISFAQTGTIKPAAAVFGEQGTRKAVTASAGMKTMAMPAATMISKGAIKL